jgi:Protein of unknown function (DUF3365)
MSLLLRVTMALIVVFALGAMVTGIACRALLERNADLHANRPDYSYQEATLNPTNLRDRATDWQADIIQRFRNDPHEHEISGERETPMGRSMYLAKPIRAERPCLECHSTAAAAPPTVIARYGSNNGFGWQLGDVIGAQVVSVPIGSAEARARGAFRAFLASLVAVFVALLIVVNLVLYLLVVQPVRRMAQIADRVSVGADSRARRRDRVGNRSAPIRRGEPPIAAEVNDFIIL